MQDPKNFISSLVGYISIAIAVLQAAMMAYNNWILTASAAPTVMEYIQLVILVGIGIVGYFTGRNADGSKKSVAQLEKQADPAKP